MFPFLGSFAILVRMSTALDQAYPLTQESVEHYRQNGWVLLREVCPSDLIGHYRDAIGEETYRMNTETRPIEERDTYGKAFLQTMNLWLSSPEVAKFTLAKRFAGIAAALLGVERVRLYHDQSLYKEPGGGHTPWHQDGFFWPIDQSRSVTLWMPLVDVPAEMGTMSFADGSHHRGIVDLNAGISDDSEAFYAGYILGAGFEVRTGGAMKAGDATFHSGVTFHKAPGNPTDRVREVMTVIYFADGVAVSEPQNMNQRNDLAQWLPGLKPGDLAASEINPLLG